MGLVQDQLGQNRLQLSPAKLLGIFSQVHVQHGAPWPPPRPDSYPGARLGAGGMAGMWSEPVQPRMVAVVMATTMSLHGVGAWQWVLTTAL